MADERRFFEEIARLEKWTKPLKDEQRLILYEELKHIPHEALKDIVGELIHSLRPNSPFPSIADLKEAWIAWKASHPEKIAREYEEEACSECGGKGYFEVVYEVVPSRFGTVEYTTMLPCAKCRNWKKIWGQKPKKLWTKAEIEAHPTFYLKGNISTPAGVEKRRNVRPLAERVGKSLDDIPF